MISLAWPGYIMMRIDRQYPQGMHDKKLQIEKDA
jgi:hypothetical protein